MTSPKRLMNFIYKEYAHDLKIILNKIVKICLKIKNKSECQMLKLKLTVFLTIYQKQKNLI